MEDQFDDQMPVRIARRVQEFADLQELLPQYLPASEAAQVLARLAQDSELTHSMWHSLSPEGAPPRYWPEFITVASAAILDDQPGQAIWVGMCAVALACSRDRKD